MTRCVSKCSGLKEEECKPPCSFVAKKYCRLSTRKMNACELTETVKPSKPTKRE